MTRFRKMTGRLCTAAALILALGTTSWGAGIRIVPSATVVKPGDEFSFDVVADDIPSQGLGGVQFRLKVNPSSGQAQSVTDLAKAGTNDIAIVTPLLISPAVAGRSGLGELFWSGKGANGILTLENETLTNGSALYTFAHTSGALPRSGSGSIARFSGKIGSSVRAERLELNLVDVMLMDGGPAYPLDYVTGASLRLRCLVRMPALAGQSATAALATLVAVNLTPGTIYEINNQNGLLPLDQVLAQSVAAGGELDCGSPVDLAINRAPDEVANLASVDKINDESGTVRLAWNLSSSTDIAGYKVYAGSRLLQQLTDGATASVEIGGLVNGAATRLRVSAYDKFGNESSGVFVDATPIDDLPPVISLAGVSDGNFVNSPVAPQVTVSDASPVTWSAVLNGEPFTLASIINDGSYNLTVSAVDQAGNRSSKTVSFTIDKTAPQIVVANVADAGFYKVSVNPVITVSDASLKSSATTLDGKPYISGTAVAEPGSHLLSIIAEDLAGNSSSKTVSFTIDQLPPALTVSTLTDGSYTNSELLNIAGVVSDNTGVKQLTVNGTAVAVQPDSSYSYPLLLVSGSNRIEVIATDLAGNATSDLRTVILDRKAPLIDITAPGDNSKTALAGLAVTGSVDETSTVEIRLAGAPQPVERNGESFNALLTLAQGVNTIDLIATDLAGNVSSEKRTVIFDDQKPSLAITEPGQDIRTNRDLLILKGAVADALTAVTVNVTMDGQTYIPAVVNGTYEQRLVLSSEGNHAIRVTATDEAGNAIDVIRNVIYDITPPALTINPVASPTNLSTAVISGTMEEGATISITIPTAEHSPVEYPTVTSWRTVVSAMLPGSNTVNVTAVDLTGNAISATTQILYDNTPPAGSMVINGGAMITDNSTVSLTLSASDENGVSRMRFSSDATTWSDSEAFATGREWLLSGSDGMKQLYVQYMDSVGNWSVEPITASIELDRTAPLLTVSPASGIFKTAQTVLLAANETAAIYYTLDGTLPTTASTGYSGSITIPATSTLRAIAIDRAGNISASHADTYVIDQLPPTMIVSTLSDGSYTNSELLNIAGVVSDNSGVKQLTVNGTAVAVQPDSSYSYPLLLVSGSNRIEVIATDLAGNATSDLRNIILDQKAPLLEITAPVDNSKTAVAEVNVSGSVDELSIVSVKLNGISQNAPVNGISFQTGVVLNPGINTIEVTAVDLSGNSSSQKRTVIYDDQKPSLSVTVPAQDYRTNQPGLLIRGAAADVYTAVAVTVDMDGQRFTPPLVDGQFEQALTFAVEKSYPIVVTATNEVGTATSVQRTVIYDATPPLLGINPVASPTVLSSQVIGGVREAGAQVTVSCPTAEVSAVIYPTETSWQATVSVMQPGINIVSVQTTDQAGNLTTVAAAITRTISNNDVIFSVSPSIISPPNHKIVPITINGKLSIPVEAVETITITLSDEYGVYSYGSLNFGSTVLVEAWRNGNDLDGRAYTITAVVTRKDGSRTTTSTVVRVPHDQSGK